jgi:hypothetical protein
MSVREKIMFTNQRPALLNYFCRKLTLHFMKDKTSLKDRTDSLKHVGVEQNFLR